MKELNKKNLYQLFLGIFFVQVVALLALSANFLLAQNTTTSTFTMKPTVENIATYPAKRLLKATVLDYTAGYDFTSVIGKIIDSAGNTTNGSPFNLTDQTANVWSYEYDTTNLSDGNYYFCVKDFYYASEISWNCSATAFNVSNTILAIPTFSIMPTVENIATYPAKKLLKATAYSNSAGQNLTKIIGKIKTTSGSLIGYSFHLTQIAGTNFWSYEYNTSNLRGDYNFCVIGDYNGTALAEICSSSFTVNNAVAIPLAINFDEDYSASAISGTKTIYAMTNKDVDSVEFKIVPSSGASTSFVGTKYATSGKYYFSWNTTALANGTYMLKAIASNGTEIADTQKTVSVYNSATIPMAPIVPTFTINAWIEGFTASGVTIGGTKNILANSTSSDSISVLNNLDFKLKKISDNTYINIGTAATTDYKNWTGNWNSTNITDGNYDFFAEGRYRKPDGTYVIYKSGFKNINISNIITAPLSISFFEDYSASVISGTKIIYAMTNNTVDKVDFKIISSAGISSVYAGAKDTVLNKYYFSWNTKILDNGAYTLKAIAYKGAGAAETQKTITINNVTTANPDTLPLQITSYYIPNKALSGTQQYIWVEINKSATVNLYIKGGPNSINKMLSGVYGNNNRYQINLSTSQFSSGSYIIKIEAKNNSEMVFKEGTFTIYNDTTIYSNSDSNPVSAPILNSVPGQEIALKINSFNVPAESLMGIQRIYININKYIPKENIKFYLAGGPNSINEKFNGYHANNFSGSEYYFEFDTTRFANGAYKIKVEILSGVEIITEIKAINIFNNQKAIADTRNYLSISECETKGITSPEACNEYMKIDYECRRNNILNYNDCSSYLKMAYLSPECIKQGITTYAKCNEIMYIKTAPDECQKDGITTKEECRNVVSINYFITPECKNENITTPEACDKYMMEYHIPYECKEKGITDREECDYILRNLYQKYEDASSVIKPEIVNNKIFMKDKLPYECQEKGIASFDECEKYLISINLPKECQGTGVKTRNECEEMLFKNYAPKECIDKKLLNPEDCENYMFKLSAPSDCKKAGISNPRSCEKFIFEKYGGKEKVPVDKLPYECKSANAKTIEECEKIMMQKYMPKECKTQGFDKEKDCEIYMNKKHMPKECQDVGAASRSECDKIMFKKFGPLECKIAGVEDEIECEEFLLNKYAQKVQCLNVEDWQCKNSIKDRHLGNMVAKENKFKKIREKQEEITGKSIKVSELEDEIIKENNSAPVLKKDLGLKILLAKENLVLNEEDDLIQTAPIFIMIDSDGDGLPDDIEERIGTDPYKIDTDGDGFDDLTEIKNGYNPKGDGELENEMNTIEKAIIENKPLEHPKTEGKTDKNFAIKQISNYTNEKGEESPGYILSGKSEPNSIATIYIYSDLPIVATVKTDEYGNWKYELKESLIDGEHEVYVAINDDTGKVVNKSKPFSFFVNEAKAVSAKDFVSEAKASFETPGKSETSISNYIVIALAMAVFGILLFLAVIKGRKKNKTLS